MQRNCAIHTAVALSWNVYRVKWSKPVYDTVISYTVELGRKKNADFEETFEGHEFCWASVDSVCTKWERVYLYVFPIRKTRTEFRKTVNVPYGTTFEIFIFIVRWNDNPYRPTDANETSSTYKIVKTLNLLIENNFMVDAYGPWNAFVWVHIT